MSTRSEHELTQVVDQVARAVVPDWDQVAPIDRFHTKTMLFPAIMSTLDWVDAQPHRPRRDDDVATWLRAKREEWADSSPDDMMWGYRAIDSLLDEYRLGADAGTDLMNLHPEEDEEASDAS